MARHFAHTIRTTGNVTKNRTYQLNHIRARPNARTDVANGRQISDLHSAKHVGHLSPKGLDLLSKVHLRGGFDPDAGSPIAEPQRITPRVVELLARIDDRSSAIGYGEFVALLGRSGCGATTMNCISRLEATTSGVVLFDNTADRAPIALRGRA